jgi:6-phosphofructokinase 1
MGAVRGQQCTLVPLEKVAGRRKTVPLDHAWIRSARLVGMCFGD